jgi:hypothetical protein
MSRLFKIMVLLVALSLCSVVIAKPTAAYAGERSEIQTGSLSDDDGSMVVETFGEPGEGGEGDPDDGCDGIGARSGESFLSGILNGIGCPWDSEMTFEEFIDLMLLQFLPSP